MRQRWPFLSIAIGLLAWAGYLALGAALNERPVERYAVLKPLIILGSMGLFLVFWWLVFAVSAKRRRQGSVKPTQKTE